MLKHRHGNMKAWGRLDFKNEYTQAYLHTAFA